MAAHIREHGGHILRDDEVPAIEVSISLRHTAHRQRAAGADAQLHHGVLPAGLCQPGDILVNGVLNFRFRRFLNQRLQLLPVNHRGHPVQGVFRVSVPQNADLAFKIGVAHADLNHEPVHLRRRQHLRSRRTHGVLGRQHHEGLGQLIGLAVHRHVQFFHGFQQGGLGLAGGAVDLVGQKQIRHDRAGLIDEAAAFLVID